MNWIIRLAVGGFALVAAGLGVATVSADNSNSQTAGNSATSSQAAAAVSGDATAGHWSDATSGGAVSTAYLSTVQSVLQHAQNLSDSDVNNSNTQDAANALDKTQQATGASGIATADANSTSTTGEVAAILAEVEKQIAAQAAGNVAGEVEDEAPPPPGDGEMMP